MVSVFVAGLLVVSGVALFSLGATFNYLVSIFHHQPVRRGLFGKPLFAKPLERHFGWMGILSMTAGTVAGFTSMVLALGGWSIERLWLYLLGAAMSVLVGLQLAVFWIIMQVLEELSHRDMEITRDMEASPCTN